MKRLILLLVSVLFLVGCGLDAAPQEGLTNAFGARGGDNMVTVSSVKCDVHPLQNSQTHAHAACELEITDDASKLGFDRPTTVYLGGALGDELSTRQQGRSFSSSGPGVLQINWSGSVVIGVLTAEFDGIRAPVDIVGVATTEGARTLEIPASDRGETNSTQLLTCEGTLVLNSRLAMITFIGEFEDGQQIVGGGLLDTNVKPLDEVCHNARTEGVVYEIETTLVEPGDGERPYRTATIRDKESGQPLIFAHIFSQEGQD